MRHFFFYKDNTYVHVPDHKEDKEEYEVTTLDVTNGNTAKLKIPADQFYHVYKPLLNKTTMYRLMSLMGV
jgi:hypothetical protein